MIHNAPVFMKNAYQGIMVVNLRNYSHTHPKYLKKKKMPKSVFMNGRIATILYCPVIYCCIFYYFIIFT